MAVVAVRLKGHAAGYRDLAPVETYVYQVQCDAITDGATLARSTIAAYGPPSGLYLRSLSAATPEGRSGLWFDVTAEYVSPSQDAWQPVPTLRPSVLSSSYMEMDEAYISDADGTSVANSAGEPFNNPPLRRTGYPILQIRKNYSSAPLLAYDALKYTTNTAAITIRGNSYDARSLLFLPPALQEMWEKVNGTNYHYYQTMFRLAVDTNHHQQQVADLGMREKKTSGDDTILVPILMPKGDGTRWPFPVSRPWPLDSGGATESPTPSTSFFFRPYPDASWGIDFS